MADDKIQLLLERAKLQKQRDTERKSTQLDLIDKRDILLQRREARKSDVQNSQLIRKGESELTLQSNEHNHQKDMVNVDFNDYVRREDIELQALQKRQDIEDMAKGAEFLRHIQETVISLKAKVVTIRAEATEGRGNAKLDSQLAQEKAILDSTLGQERAVLDSKLRINEYREQKQSDILFMLMAKKLRLSSNGNLSKEQIAEYVAEFADRED